MILHTFKNKKLEIIESLRGFASIYIVIHHFLGFSSLKNITPAWVHMPFRFGQEMVLLFFLMSGFVIYASNQKIENIGFAKYFEKRFLRIYPIFLLTLLLSYFVLMLNKEQFLKGDLSNFIGNLFMLQDTGNKPGAIVYPFLKNYPLWSLSYEWWFYMLFFPLVVIFDKVKILKTIPNIYYILLISVISWSVGLVIPNHILLILSNLIIWWAGVYIAQLFFSEADISFKTLIPVYVSFFVMALLSLIPLVSFLQKGIKPDFNNYPVLDVRHFSFGLVIVIIGQILYRYKNVNWGYLISPMGKLAPISYAMYCVHFPIILLKIPFITNELVLFIVKLVLIFGISFLLEIVIQPYLTDLQKREKSIPITA